MYKMILINLIVLPISLFPHFPSIYRMSYSRNGFVSPKPAVQVFKGFTVETAVLISSYLRGQNQFIRYIFAQFRIFEDISVDDIIHGTTFKLNSMIQFIDIKTWVKFEWWLMAHIRIINNNEINYHNFFVLAECVESRLNVKTLLSLSSP